MKRIEKPVVVGTVGYGYGAYLHANGYLNSGLPVRLKTVCARNQEKAEAFRERYGYEQTVDDYEKLLSDPEIDMIDLSVPPALHIDYSIRALKAGKHIICEKPVSGYFGRPGEENIGATVPKAVMWERMQEDLKTLKKVIDESDKKFMYAENFVYATPVQKTAEILRAKKNKIVLMYGVETIIGSTSPAAGLWKNFGGGTVMRNGIHILSTMLYLKMTQAKARGEKFYIKSVVADMTRQSDALDPAEPRYIQAHPQDVEDMASITVTFYDNTKAVVVCSDAVLGGSQNHINVCCSDMTMNINLTPTNLLNAFAMDEKGLENVEWGELNPRKLGWNGVFVSDPVIRGYGSEMADFVSAAAFDREPEVGFDFAYQVIRTVYAAYRSNEEGRRIDLGEE